MLKHGKTSYPFFWMQSESTIRAYQKWDNIGTRKGKFLAPAVFAHHKLFCDLNYCELITSSVCQSFQRASFLKCLLLFATQIKFICIVIHATNVSIHLVCALLVKIFQPAVANISKFRLYNQACQSVKWWACAGGLVWCWIESFISNWYTVH